MNRELRNCGACLLAVSFLLAGCASQTPPAHNEAQPAHEMPSDLIFAELNSGKIILYESAPSEVTQLLDRNRLESSKRPPGIKGMSVAEVRVTEIVQTHSGSIAIVLVSDDLTYIVRTGTKFFDATVSAVKDDRIVLKPNERHRGKNEVLELLLGAPVARGSEKPNMEKQVLMMPKTAGFEANDELFLRGVLSDLEQLISPQTVLTRVTYQKGRVRVIGLATDVNAVANLIGAIESDSRWNELILRDLVAGPEVTEFSISMAVKAD